MMSRVEVDTKSDWDKPADELLVIIDQETVQAATGLDKARCPLGVALRAIDPQSVWVVGSEAVCRYYPNDPDGGDCYELPHELRQFLDKWIEWFALSSTGLSNKPFVLPAPIEFVLQPHKYPAEHLVPDYVHQATLMDHFASIRKRGAPF